MINMRPDYELRLQADSQFETRSEGSTFKIAGYAAVFDSRSQNLGGFVEQIARGAFAKTIQEADVRALFNHDSNFVLGRNRSGTLRMAEDSTGLHYEVDLPDTTFARDLYTSMERGDITQSSFGFGVIADDWGLTQDEFPLRTLKEVSLYDVSPVTYPAYLSATSEVAGARALERLAEMRNLDLDTVKHDLTSVLKAQDETPVKTTFVTRLHVPSDIVTLRGRFK